MEELPAGQLCALALREDAKVLLVKPGIGASGGAKEQARFRLHIRGDVGH